MNQMRVAYITADPGVPVFGRKGCSIHVQEVLRAMVNRGATVHLFATNIVVDEITSRLLPVSEASAPDALKNIQLHPLAVPPKGPLAAREQSCLAQNEPNYAILRSQGPFDFVYERYSLWGFAGMEYARDHGIPGLLEVNAPLIEEQQLHRGLIDRHSAENVARRAFEAASVLVAVSDEVAGHLEQFPDARGKIRVVPNGVNPSRFPDDIEATLTASDGTFTVGFVGSMKPWHGLENLLNAFAILRERSPSCRLLMVGDGTARGEFETQLRERGLSEAVHFTGAVPASQVPGLLASMDVGVAPYPPLGNFYFSPLKVYEYMAAGLPVVASRIGQLEKLITPEQTGLLVAPGDVTALAAALERLRTDPALRLRLGQAAREKVFREHTWDQVVGQILNLAEACSESSAKKTLRAHATT